MQEFRGLFSPSLECQLREAQGFANFCSLLNPQRLAGGRAHWRWPATSESLSGCPRPRGAARWGRARDGAATWARSTPGGRAPAAARPPPASVRPQPCARGTCRRRTRGGASAAPLRPCPRPSPGPAVYRGATPCPAARSARAPAHFPAAAGRGAGAGPRPSRAAGSGALFAGRGPGQGVPGPRTDIKGESSARGAAGRLAAPRSADPGIRSGPAAREGGARPAPAARRPGFESRLAASRACLASMSINTRRWKPSSVPAPSRSLAPLETQPCAAVPGEEKTR